MFPLQDVRAQLAGQLEELTATVKLDAQETAALAERSYTSLSQELNAKVAEIQSAEEEHRQQQQLRLQQYRELYDRTKPMQEVWTCSAILWSTA